jgi:ATP-dependent Clp protease ATP-binding subunit ClpA
MIDVARPRVRALLERLSPYARHSLESAAAFALSIHADELGPEHLLCALMDDEESAAHRVAAHAFADPATISEETRALAAGIMISGSSASLPFSALGVKALRRARADAARRRSRAVEPSHLVLASFDELAPELREPLEDSGWSRANLEALAVQAGPGAQAVEDVGALFRSFSDEAKRLLSGAGKLARQGGQRSISHGHLLLASLSSDMALERAAGLPPSRVRIALRGRLEDLTPVEGGPLDLDDAAEAYLERLPPGAGTLELLRAFHAGGTAELAQILTRHKVSVALLDRAAEAFLDP